MSKMSRIFFLCLIIINFTHAQVLRRTLYGLPLLPEDEQELLATIRTTTTVKPLVQRVFPQLLFTIPPMVTLPPIAPYMINPIPELPPMAESRIDGHFNDDGEFIPNKKQEEKQLNENRIHGVKTEAIPTPKVFNNHPPTPKVFHHGLNDDPPKAYSKVRGITLVTVSPSRLPPNYYRMLTEEPSSEVTKKPFSIKSGGTRKIKNPRQWQTTAQKIVNGNEKIDVDGTNDGLFDGSIESIDKTTTIKSNEIHDGPKTRAFKNSTPKPRRILTTNYPVGQLSNSVVTPPPPRKIIGNMKHLNIEKMGQRTTQPENVVPTGKPRVFVPRPRQLPNPPKSQQIFYNPKPVQVAAQPLPRLVILPPQPYNRAPEDAAFLAEVEEYDWKLHYKQHDFESSPPRVNPLSGYNRANGSPQIHGITQSEDYDDIIALQNREHFTDNPPQKSFAIPSSIQPRNEVLIPFNNPKGRLSAADIEKIGQAPTAHRIGSNFVPNNQNQQFQSATPNPIFGGLFNFFNFNTNQNPNGFLFPGFGR